jgi:hypothetical protein
MRISRLTVDKLGVKLYDKISAVLAELVANAYDADATEVTICAPMDTYLATKSEKKTTDLGFEIIVKDNGHGMTPDEINAFYLLVGAERRNDPRRGGHSRKFKRRVMGRKGVGKLAPFGVCERIEIISSGGEKRKGIDATGRRRLGYLTAHLTLDRRKILSDTDTNYHPLPGPLDGTIGPKTGTTLKLTLFDYRRVPALDELSRQLSQRFGSIGVNWMVKLQNALADKRDPQALATVGAFDIPRMPGTELFFRPDNLSGGTGVVVDGLGAVVDGLLPGFKVDGHFYPVEGYVAYAKHAFKDDLMAGVRIYCRGKIAAQTLAFNQKSGFTGEFGIRSYLIGELLCDWIDEDEDLIQTDRRDILWSSDLGSAFEEWGREVVRYIGQLARNPLKKKTFDRFVELTNLSERINSAFPAQDQSKIRDAALSFAKLVGQKLREDELNDPEQLDDLVSVCLLLAPHVTLDETLREAADTKDSPLTVVTSILRIARVAELSSFGRIADDRVRVILNLETLKDSPGTVEEVFQSLIEQAPWLIDPQWSPITTNQSFSTLRTEFTKFVKKETGEDIEFGKFDAGSKRADFVLSNQDDTVEMIEIKRPNHKLTNDEMVRIDKYWRLMKRFLDDPQNEEFKRRFPRVHITLVCDHQRLKGPELTAYEGLKEKGALTHINWRTFLLRTRRAHEEFLKEAERQKQLATQADIRTAKTNGH